MDWLLWFGRSGSAAVGQSGFWGLVTVGRLLLVGRCGSPVCMSPHALAILLMSSGSIAVGWRYGSVAVRWSLYVGLCGSAPVGPPWYVPFVRLHIPSYVVGRLL